MKLAEEIDKLSLKLLDNINKLSFLDLPSFRLKTYDCLEQIPRNIQCVYFIFSKKFGLLYIGKTNDLNRRLSKPYQGQIHDGLLAIMLFKDCEVYYFESRKETLSLIEEALIFKHSPAKKLLNAKGIDRYKKEQHGTKTAICCPYHIEKTPSCSINMDTGYFHCFSCQEQGSLERLISKIEMGENG